MFAEIFRPPFAKEPQQPGVGRWLQILTNSKARKVVLASFFYLMNTGQIVKGKRKHDFAIIPNEISQSKQLTMQEKGMLCFLLSLPENWILYKKNLYEQMPDSKYTIDMVFSSLQGKGYIFSSRQMDPATGKMVGWNHIVYDAPQFDRDADLPISGNTDVGKNRESVNEGIYKETNTNKETIKYKYAFEDFWLAYDKKVDKKQTQVVWNKLSPEDRILAVEGMGNHKNGRERKYWKDPIRYLRDRRWEDETTNTNTNTKQTNYSYDPNDPRNKW
jgi:hypothetical protein